MLFWRLVPFQMFWVSVCLDLLSSFFQNLFSQTNISQNEENFSRKLKLWSKLKSQSKKTILENKPKIFSTLIEPQVGLQILKIPFCDSYYVSLCSVKLWALSGAGCLCCAVAEKKLESKNYV